MVSTTTQNTLFQEIEPIRTKHPEYHWLHPQAYILPLISFPQIDTDLVPRLVNKVEEMTVEYEPFHLFGYEYRVRIDDIIRIVCLLQDEYTMLRIYKDLFTFFYPHLEYYEYVPDIVLGTYRIPAKQQYSHLKNDLAKIPCTFEMEVSTLHIVQKKEQGNMVLYEPLHTIPLRA